MITIRVRVAVPTYKFYTYDVDAENESKTSIDEAKMEVQRMIDTGWLNENDLTYDTDDQAYDSFDKLLVVADAYPIYSGEDEDEYGEDESDLLRCV